MVVYTDHLPLVSALRNHSNRYTEREFRQLDFLSQFDLEFRHVKGAENEVADAFSRISISSLRFAQSVDYEALAQAQLDANLSSAQLPPSCSSFPLRGTSLTLPRPMVPLVFRRTIFEALHGLAHPGVKASVTLIASRLS